jgi:uncharacterized membrane protein YebE (DUF533 family)
MALGNIVGGLLAKGMSSQSHRRLRTGAEHADRTGGVEQMLGAFLGGRRGMSGIGGGLGGMGAGIGTGTGSLGTGGQGLADMAREFLNKPQAGGMSGAKIGGLGALAGGLLGGGLGGAAKGGAMAILGTLALQAWRQHQAGPNSGAVAAEPTEDEVQALTAPQSERLVLRAMIGAAQVDGHISDAEMDKILGHMRDGEVTEDERRAVREEVSRPVDVEAIGREVSRPEVATEVYLAALMSVDIDTEAERDYFRRLARALRLEQGIVDRLHKMTGAPKP